METRPFPQHVRFKRYNSRGGKHSRFCSNAKLLESLYLGRSSRLERSKMCWPTDQHIRICQVPKESVIWAWVSAARGGLIWWNLWQAMIASTRILEFIYIYNIHEFAICFKILTAFIRKSTGFKGGKTQIFFFKWQARKILTTRWVQEILGASHASQRLRARQSRCEVPDGYDKDGYISIRFSHMWKTPGLPCLDRGPLL